MKQFAGNSRYLGVEVRKMTVEGREVSCLARRFVPGPEKYSTLGIVAIEAGDRPDLLAYRTIGDPEQYWKIADANAVLHPMELTEVVGRRVRLTLPEGMPSMENDA